MIAWLAALAGRTTALSVSCWLGSRIVLLVLAELESCWRRRCFLLSFFFSFTSFSLSPSFLPPSIPISISPSLFSFLPRLDDGDRSDADDRGDRHSSRAPVGGEEGDDSPLPLSTAVTKPVFDTVASAAFELVHEMIAEGG